MSTLGDYGVCRTLAHTDTPSVTRCFFAHLKLVLRQQRVLTFALKRLTIEQPRDFRWRVSGHLTAELRLLTFLDVTWFENDYKLRRTSWLYNTQRID